MPARITPMAAAAGLSIRRHHHLDPSALGKALDTSKDGNRSEGATIGAVVAECHCSIHGNATMAVRTTDSTEIVKRGSFALTIHSPATAESDNNPAWIQCAIRFAARRLAVMRGSFLLFELLRNVFQIPLRKVAIADEVLHQRLGRSAEHPIQKLSTSLPIAVTA